MLFKLFVPVQVKAYASRFVSKAPAIFLSVFRSNAVAQGTLPVDHFEFSTISSPKVAYVPFRVLITAKAADGTTARGFRSTVTLTAADAGGFVPVEAQTALQFVSGQWSGLIGVNTGDTTVTLTVMDGSGHRGDAGPITIQAPPFRVVDLPVVSLVSDRGRKLLYASLGPPSPSAGAIALIDPVTGLVQDTIPVQGGAGRLELADDASVLYAATADWCCAPDAGSGYFALCRVEILVVGLLRIVMPNQIAAPNRRLPLRPFDGQQEQTKGPEAGRVIVEE